MSKKYDVICIGAALVDMIAKVERHPQEDDEVFVSDLTIFSGGAAANTAFACASLGLKSAFLGKLGRGDAFGSKILDDFKKGRVSVDLIKYSDDQKTRSAYVALNEKADRRIYAHSGAANYLSENEIKSGELSKAKVIYLSSLKNMKPFIKAGIIGKKMGIPVILNPGMLIIDQGYESSSLLFKNIDILILSQKEYSTLMKTDKLKLSPSFIVQTSNKLFELGIRVLIVTLGSKGAFMQTEDNFDAIPAIKIEAVVDTTGAGDAFSAGFVYGFLQNLSFDFERLKNDVKIGHYIAGKCIQELGARNGIINQEEFNDFLEKTKWKDL